MKTLLCFTVLAATLASVPLHAQTTSGAQSTYDQNRSSWLPYTRNGYVGLNVGRPKYSLDCGLTGNCDDPNTSVNVYVGGMFNPYAGLEFGYLNMGNADRGGGTTRAQGVNLSLVGNMPIASSFSLFAKVGATYGRTRVDAPVIAGLATGKESGWGPSYGLGASWNFSNNWSAVLDWQRHRFDFAGDQNEWVRSTSVGLRYRF